MTEGRLWQVAGLPISAWAALIVQATLIVIWAVRLDGRVVQQEREILRVLVSTESISNRLQNFIERVDRLDTPLAKHVGQLQILVSAINDRVSAQNSQILIQRTDLSRIEKQLDDIRKDVEELRKLPHVFPKDR